MSAREVKTPTLERAVFTKKKGEKEGDGGRTGGGVKPGARQNLPGVGVVIARAWHYMCRWVPLGAVATAPIKSLMMSSPLRFVPFVPFILYTCAGEK